MKRRKVTESRRKFFNVDPPQIWRDLKDRIDESKERRAWDKEVDGTKAEKKEKAKKVEKKQEKSDREEKKQEKKQQKKKEKRKE